MQLQALKLVTLVAEEILKSRLQQKVLELGASGYNMVEAQGYGSRGLRSDATGTGNVKMEIVCPQEVAEKILTYVSHNYFDNYAVIAWVTDVNVMRGAQYIKK